MATQTDIIKERIIKLNSGNPLLIKETLFLIKEDGNKDYIPVLIELLVKYKDTTSANYICDFLSDIKSTDIKKVIISYITNIKFKDIKANLLSICWESAVDFSEYLSIFIDCLINDNFKSSFEALTVIENLEASLENNIIEKEIEKLKDAILNCDETKQILIHDTLKILKDKLNN